jgi:hypothetical protein
MVIMIKVIHIEKRARGQQNRTAITLAVRNE